MTDDGMQSIGQMTKLKVLHIMSRRITDAGLAHLENVTLVNAPNVTKAGIAKLKSQRPKLSVSIDNR